MKSVPISRATTVAGVALAFFGLAAATEALATTTHDFALASSLVVMLFAGALLTRGGRGRTLRGQAALGLLVSLLGLAVVPIGAELRFIGFSIHFAGLAAFNRSRGAVARPLEGLACAALIFGLLRIGFATSLLAWYTERSFAHGLSAVAAGTTRLPLALNPSYAGLDVALLAVCIVVGQWWSARHPSPRTLLVAAGAIAMVALAYLQLVAWLPAEHALDSVTGVLEDTLYPLHMGVVLALLLTPCLVWYQRRLPLSPPGPVDGPAAATARPRTRRRWAPPGAAVCTLGAAMLWTMPPEAPGDDTTVVIYEKGYVNWLSPNRKRFGTGSIGMMGNLPGFVEALGYTCRRVGDLDDTVLDEADVLVIVNKMDDYPADRVDAIDRFMARGGGLLLLGDHTALHRTKLPGNQLLTATDIRFNFDNAEFLVGGWLHGYDYWPHETTAGIGDHANDAGSVIGASLDISYPAVPLVVGRAGFSDPGDETASRRGYMSNRDYDSGERLGDMVLVAAQDVGRGRVVVFGDTSAFSNGLLTQCWPFVSRVFRWLASDGRAAVSLWRELAALTLLVAALVLVLMTPHFETPVWTGALLALLLGLPGLERLGAGELPLLRESIVIDADDGSARRRPIALIDEGHRSSAPRATPDGKGMSNVYVNLMRDGWLPVATKDLDTEQLEAADLLFVPSPTKAYSEREAAEVLDFVHDGGTLILTTAWEQRQAVAAILEPLDMRLRPRPLGRMLGRAVVNDEKTLEPIFWNAWEIDGGEPVAEIEGTPVVARRPHGQGCVIVVADDKFFLDTNVEHHRQIERRNIEFFFHLISLSRES